MIVQILYPGGTQVPSVTGQTIKIFRGWPSNLGLNSDLAAGTSNVTVFSDAKHARETTRYPRVWREVNRVPVTLVATVSASSVTFSGTCLVGQVTGIEVDGQSFVVSVSTGDTPRTLAGRFGAVIPDVLVSGATVMFPSGKLVSARVVAGGTASMETRRQEQDILVGVWCPTPSARDTLAACVDAALSQVDWLQFPDFSSGLLRFRATAEIDTSENANLYRRDLTYCLEYPTTITAAVPAMLYGRLVSAGPPLVAGSALDTSPGENTLLGAIRFDAWYDPSSVIDQQCAAALSNPLWTDRLPANSTMNGSQVSWPIATQAVLDAEIQAAVIAGVDFWAFDSFGPDDGLSRALDLYLSSALRSDVRFCMLGQSSNWGDPTSATGYSAGLARDIALMAQPGYVRVLDGRPLYLVLDGTASQWSNLPSGGVAQALVFVRSQVGAMGLGNPYIVWLSAAALADFDNVTVAQQMGADAAGAYACPRMTGATQSYADLSAATQSDWLGRAQSGFDMVATAMTGWDQRPLIESPQPFYPLPSTTTDQDYYVSGSAADIAAHVAALKTFTTKTRSCASGVGLIYAWNELVEGGWLMPTYSAAGADQSRVRAVGSALLNTTDTDITRSQRLV